MRTFSSVRTTHLDLQLNSSQFLKTFYVAFKCHKMKAVSSNKSQGNISKDQYNKKSIEA